MINLPSDWQEVFKDEIQKEYYKTLINKIEKEYETKTIYPKKEDIFNAFKFTPFKKVKVVIIGQDPYHQKNQAHGLCFSVKPEVKIPPSLRNIYKELESDLGLTPADNGYLESWAKEGVLMLNTIFTVEDSTPGSHKNLGWEKFTKSVIKKLNEKDEPIIFLLWGNFAKSFKSLIDENKHFILEAAHPSPLSAYHGFFGCKHFSKTNNLLKKMNVEPIDWKIKNINN